MSIITIHEAKTHLSQLIQRALDGEEIIIAKRDQPLVRLEVIREKKPERRFGGLKDIVIRMSDSFDDPMDELGNWGSEQSSKVAEDSATYGKKK